MEEFEAKFRDKTGQEWDDVLRVGFTRVAGKYTMLVHNTERRVQESRAGGVIWQYYVGDGVDGKATGWYDYEEDASDVVEGLHVALEENPAHF